jgi:oxepin-CoA hydrolase/3-oxo-5,6-dehydrosuberyl-CoA semialdehyde dehydrogenase
VWGAADGFSPRGERVAGGAFFPPTLLCCTRPHEVASVHELEAFGPVAMLMP